MGLSYRFSATKRSYLGILRVRSDSFIASLLLNDINLWPSIITVHSQVHLRILVALSLGATLRIHHRVFKRIEEHLVDLGGLKLIQSLSLGLIVKSPRASDISVEMLGAYLSFFPHIASAWHQQFCYALMSPSIGIGSLRILILSHLPRGATPITLVFLAFEDSFSQTGTP